MAGRDWLDPDWDNARNDAFFGIPRLIERFKKKSKQSSGTIPLPVEGMVRVSRDTHPGQNGASIDDQMS